MTYVLTRDSSRQISCYYRLAWDSSLHDHFVQNDSQMSFRTETYGRVWGISVFLIGWDSSSLQSSEWHTCYSEWIWGISTYVISNESERSHAKLLLVEGFFKVKLFRMSLFREGLNTLQEILHSLRSSEWQNTLSFRAYRGISNTLHYCLSNESERSLTKYSFNRRFFKTKPFRMTCVFG